MSRYALGLFERNPHLRQVNLSWTRYSYAVDVQEDGSYTVTDDGIGERYIEAQERGFHRKSGRFERRFRWPFEASKATTCLGLSTGFGRIGELESPTSMRKIIHFLGLTETRLFIF